VRSIGVLGLKLDLFSAPSLRFKGLNVVDCPKSGAEAVFVIEPGTKAWFEYGHFTNNTIRVFYVKEDAGLTVDSSIFKNNSAQWIPRTDTGTGSAMKCKGPGARVEFKNNAFLRNKAEVNGGAIAAVSCDVVIATCIFESNEAKSKAGAIDAIFKSNLYLYYTSFYCKCACTLRVIY